MVENRKELPGDVLIAFRQTKGHPRSINAFAELAGTNYTKIHRLESIRWGVDASEWLTPYFDMTDLAPFIEEGWISVGDEWYQRFLGAFKWQAKVMQFGPAIYKGIEPEGSEYAPIYEEHLSVVIRAVFGKLKAELAPSQTVEEANLKQAEDKLHQGVRSILEAVDLLIGEGNGPDDDVTRGLLQGLTETSCLPDSPYVHTLRFAIECASVIGRERIADAMGVDGSG
jgi:hypothetical protein